MFETAVQEKPSGIRWGVILGIVTLAILLGAGYVLVSPDRAKLPYEVGRICIFLVPVWGYGSNL
jgi:hypothetical protein